MSRILVVDDDPAVRVSIGWMLRDAGHDVAMAGDGKEALALLKSEKSVDLVVADILMPRMDGLELIAALRTSLPRMKVIAISGGGFFCGSDLFLGMGRKCGAARVLEKPISASQLQDAIRDALSELPPRSASAASAR
jgi:CheY-like chemotaxis protein